MPSTLIAKPKPAEASKRSRAARPAAEPQAARSRRGAQPRDKRGPAAAAGTQGPKPRARSSSAAPKPTGAKPRTDPERRRASSSVRQPDAREGAGCPGLREQRGPGPGGRPAIQRLFVLPAVKRRSVPEISRRCCQRLRLHLLQVNPTRFPLTADLKLLQSGKTWPLLHNRLQKNLNQRCRKNKPSWISHKAFTVIPPNPKKRREIQKKAEAELAALEELRLSRAMAYVSINPSSVGGCMSLEEVRLKQQQEMMQAKRKQVRKQLMEEAPVLTR